MTSKETYNYLGGWFAEGIYENIKKKRYCSRH